LTAPRRWGIDHEKSRCGSCSRPGDKCGRLQRPPFLSCAPCAHKERAPTGTRSSLRCARQG